MSLYGVSTFSIGDTSSFKKIEDCPINSPNFAFLSTEYSAAKISRYEIKKIFHDNYNVYPLIYTFISYLYYF